MTVGKTRKENHPQRICRARAPEALSGDLGPFFCSREVTKKGVHTGDHRAHKTVVGVGRLNVLWKQDGVVSVGPPVITLPSVGGDVLNPRKRYRPEGVRCQCPAHWVGQHLHYPGCPLAAM